MSESGSAVQCDGWRRAPTEVRKGTKGWARKYGIGLCPLCGKWVTLHKDRTLVHHGTQRRTALVQMVRDAEALGLYDAPEVKL